MKERVSKVQNREKRNLSSPLSWLWVSSLLCFFFSDVRSSEPSFVLSSCDLGKEKSTTFQNRHQIWDLTISIWLEWAALRCAVLRACLCLCVYVSRLFGNVRDLDKLNTTGGTISKNEIQNEKCNANGFMEEIIKRPPRTSRVDSQVSRSCHLLLYRFLLCSNRQWMN